MGLFDFFKPKNKTNNRNKLKKPPIEPNTKDEFDLKFSDFDTKTHAAEVISVKLSPDFYELFPEAKQPMKTGNKLEVKTMIVEVIFWGRSVEVTFDADVSSNSLEEFINKINNQLNWLIKNKHMVDEVIIRDLLSLKNDSWLDEDKAALSREKFIEKICLTSIDFDEKAGINLHYDDGDTFFGHTIVVEISSKREIKEASIAG
jgi:hypothetical protein